LRQLAQANSVSRYALSATTTLYGLATPDDPYRLARVRVNRSDGVDGFAAKLVELGKR